MMLVKNRASNGASVKIDPKVADKRPIFTPEEIETLHYARLKDLNDMQDGQKRKKLMKEVQK